MNQMAYILFSFVFLPVYEKIVALEDRGFCGFKLIGDLIERAERRLRA
jgi:hypothetical protein